MNSYFARGSYVFCAAFWVYAVLLGACTAEVTANTDYWSSAFRGDSIRVDDCRAKIKDIYETHYYGTWKNAHDWSGATIERGTVLENNDPELHVYVFAAGSYFDKLYSVQLNRDGKAFSTKDYVVKLWDLGACFDSQNPSALIDPQVFKNPTAAVGDFVDPQAEGIRHVLKHESSPKSREFGGDHTRKYIIQIYKLGQDTPLVELFLVTPPKFQRLFPATTLQWSQQSEGRNYEILYGKFTGYRTRHKATLSGPNGDLAVAHGDDLGKISFAHEDMLEINPYLLGDLTLSLFRRHTDSNNPNDRGNSQIRWFVEQREQLNLFDD